MKKLIAILSIFLVVIFLGCLQTAQPKHVFVGKNCGSNMTCYHEALQNCEKANVSLTQSMNGMSVTVYSDIQGGNVSACKVYEQIRNVEVPENTSSVEKMAMQMLNGADGTCIGPVDELTKGVLEGDVNCTGTLFSMMKSMAPQQNASTQGRKTLSPTLS